MAARQAPNKTLEAMVPTPYGESQIIAAAPSIGAVPRPADDTMLRALEGTDARPIEGVKKDITFAQGARKSISAISWTCVTNRGNRLFYAGVPFVARYLAWSAFNISWQAGLGWPVFTSYCPVSDYDYRFKFPNAFRFQIVPVFGNYYWTGCGPSASGTGTGATEVWVWVNDFPDLYGDNAGTFEFLVTGWST
jgi:hypothetical protein